MQKLTNLTKDELIELIIREREASSGWQPIESAPDEVRILVVGGHIFDKLSDGATPLTEPTVVINRGGCFDVVDSCFYSVGVYSSTHWQPLPAPPMEV